MNAKRLRLRAICRRYFTGVLIHLCLGILFLAGIAAGCGISPGSSTPSFSSAAPPIILPSGVRGVADIACGDQAASSSALVLSMLGAPEPYRKEGAVICSLRVMPFGDDTSPGPLSHATLEITLWEQRFSSAGRRERVCVGGWIVREDILRHLWQDDPWLPGYGLRLLHQDTLEPGKYMWRCRVHVQEQGTRNVWCRELSYVHLSS